MRPRAWQESNPHLTKRYPSLSPLSSLILCLSPPLIIIGGVPGRAEEIGRAVFPSRNEEKLMFLYVGNSSDCRRNAIKSPSDSCQRILPDLIVHPCRGSTDIEMAHCSLAILQSETSLSKSTDARWVTLWFYEEL
ncbi:uncharacterized protein LOC143180162 [Calliopsis andreniformis]|uniref:uncharacterized protein LOC143180162 n=1 Tax=Calliopsis andreniformis TaxID=337506 RepID=UPI003FCEBC72